MRDFRQLRVWREAHGLALEVYQAARHFPRRELYGLESQVCRSAVSVPANIAEGSGRSTAADFCRFLDIASGSASELEALLLIAHGLGYVTAEVTDALCTRIQHVRRMIARLSRKVRRDVAADRLAPESRRKIHKVPAAKRLEAGVSAETQTDPDR